MSLLKELLEMNIPDPSDYRYGDEHDPRSPYFNGPDYEGPKVEEVKGTLDWYVYDDHGNEITDSAKISIVLEYEDDGDERFRGKVVSFKVVDVVVLGQHFNDLESAEAAYPGNFKLKDVQEVAEDHFVK